MQKQETGNYRLVHCPQTPPNPTSEQEGEEKYEGPGYIECYEPILKEGNKHKKFNLLLMIKSHYLMLFAGANNVTRQDTHNEAEKMRLCRVFFTIPNNKRL